jgi:hypothetical protein
MAYALTSVWVATQRPQISSEMWDHIFATW